MQEAIFKVNTVKEVAKCLKYDKYDNVIKQEVRKRIKHVKNVVQSWYLRLQQTIHNGM